MTDKNYDRVIADPSSHLDTLVPAKVASAMLSLSTQWLRKLALAGRLRGYKSGKVWLFKVSDLLALSNAVEYIPKVCLD